MHGDAKNGCLLHYLLLLLLQLAALALPLATVRAISRAASRRCRVKLTRPVWPGRKRVSHNNGLSPAT